MRTLWAWPVLNRRLEGDPVLAEVTAHCVEVLRHGKKVGHGTYHA